MRSQFPYRVLVVDDDRMYGEMVRVRGREVGVQVHAVRGDEVARIREQLALFDLIVVDGDLGQATGAELAEVLSRVVPTKPLVLTHESPKPWMHRRETPPNVRAIVTKWEGIDGVLATAIHTLETQDKG